MSKVEKKFYRKGTLEEKGTKVTLKTRPYINGMVFNTEDPITSFHQTLAAIKIMIEEYEMLRSIPGINDAVRTALDLNSGITGRAKLLLDFLSQSPIEITLKDQSITNEILNDLEINNIGDRYER